MKNTFEILAPAGSLEILKQVIKAGADAVYLGGEMFGARAYANNFSNEELLEALEYAHLRGKKIYLTVNTLLKNQEIIHLYDYLLPFYEKGLDAVLVQDLGVLKFIHEHFPDLPIHTSTQMTITGVDAISLLKKYGVTRVVMAREMSIPEMREIHEKTGMELEAFVHGALCYSYSGQCLFSSMLGGRSGNRGRCAQPCRLCYSVSDENQKSLLKDSYVLSLKDMCGIKHLNELKDAGVYSLKIEGRMKSIEYASGVVAMYRKYVDLLEQKQEIMKSDYERLLEIGNRCGFTDTYMTKHNGKDMVTFEKPSFLSKANYVSGEEKYIPIIGKASFHVNQSARLSVCLEAEEISVTADGGTCLLANNKPLLKEDLIARISKTKDTAFLFQNLDIEMDSDVFLPNGVINQLKRDAIALLEAKILEKYQRNSSIRPVFSDSKGRKEKKDKRYIISIENRTLLSSALKYDWVSDIYIDSSAYSYKNFFEETKEDIKKCHNAKKSVYFILPNIFRKRTSDFYHENQTQFFNLSFDGYVVKSYEELQFIKNNVQDKELIAEHNLYTYNDYATSFLLEEGVGRVTVPLELNRNEISKRDNASSQMILYGYYPLMVSASCVNKNAASCDKIPKLSYLKDRYNKQFPVKNLCNDCINVIYNSVPTLLFSSYKELCMNGISDFRLHFTIENHIQMEQVCDAFGDLLEEKDYQSRFSKNMEFTNGHYKRGVE